MIIKPTTKPMSSKCGRQPFTSKGERGGAMPNNNLSGLEDKSQIQVGKNGAGHKINITHPSGGSSSPTKGDHRDYEEAFNFSPMVGGL